MRKLFLVGFLAMVLFVFGCVESPTGSVIGYGSSVDVSGKLENDVRVINAKAFRFDFDPNPIIVNKGERIKIIMTSVDVTHGFALPDFNINVPLPAGRPTTIDFVADKQGTFPFTCSVYCGSGHSAMSGTLVVR